MASISTRAEAPRTEHLVAILPFPTESFADQVQKLKKSHPTLKTSIYYLPLGTTTFIAQEQIPDDVFLSATILMTLSAFPPTPAHAPRLKLTHAFSAGIDHIASSWLYTSSTLPITTSSGVHGPQIAEWCMATYLSLTHHLPRMHSWQRAHTWHLLKDVGTVHSAPGKTLGVFGYGGIGRQVGRLGKALGMRVLAFTAREGEGQRSRSDEKYVVPGTGDPEGEIPDMWFGGVGDKEKVRAFLAQGIDWLVITTPLTPLTRGVIGKQELEILAKGSRTGAIVSNPARGEIIDQDALIETLKRPIEEGGLAGAALDTAYPEPLPAECELWSMENVLLTPHCSGLSTEYGERSFDILEKNLTRLEKGGKLLNVVDRKKGY